MAITSASPAYNEATGSHERSSRRRPFASWVKKLAAFKNGSSSADSAEDKRDGPSKTGKKLRPSKNRYNNPYPQSGRVPDSTPAHHSQPSLSTAHTHRNVSFDEDDGRSRGSILSGDGPAPPTTAGGLSMAGTVSTDHDASHSIHAPSHMASSVAGTSRTANGGFDGRRGEDSTFSSPAPSVRSLTTTLTTIQSVNPNTALNAPGGPSQSQAASQGNPQTIQFTQPFPSVPASAIPAHLAPHGPPNTYNTATANNLLTDNASILTLASSSKRRRRRSMDTDASVRALAPSSLWGGSRESLPLSVLSANVDGSTTMQPGTSVYQGSSRIAGAERTSIYSATGVAPALPSERNSYYAGKQLAGDAVSVRSGFFGHNRADSVTGSVGGVNSPLASPREVSETERPLAPGGDENTDPALEHKEKQLLDQ
ncbi:uncharacterized protein B0I36DRAFT_367581 [Microdochium trichocladiopsis]|uniref:Ca2+-modulated nonselective cation channel polycystin n=1 Tax=Microdochium trichocladiopsis TaxID=1682393 RepID=A0A9P8XWC2_9PEZI|nr:uncharacterized protein B0I36DRAFT_367581 [Microdochium trichocladiopsis]KAH7021142.1 hypothetical protein B0I36DRAFT_367581 [Microdochium trichocladiopsis]